MDARKRAGVPAIHVFAAARLLGLGYHRNSGLPELRDVKRRKSGKPDLR
jgi:hypothetical protein